MTLQQAIEILSNHNKWRLGSDIPPTDPQELTQALELAINVLIHLN